MVVCYSIVDLLVQFEPVTRDLDPIWIRIHCVPNTLAIQRPTDGMIWGLVPVHAVKIRRRFGPKNRVISCECSFPSLVKQGFL